MSDPQTAETEAVAAELDAADAQNDSVETGTTSDIAGENDTESAPTLQETASNDPVGPVVVLEVDRLKAENLNLKLLNSMNQEAIVQGRIKDLQGQLNEINGQRAELTAQMQAMRVDVEAKYGINLATHVIQPESGVVTPRPQAPGNMDPAAMAAAIQQMQADTKG